MTTLADIDYPEQARRARQHKAKVGQHRNTTVPNSTRKPTRQDQSNRRWRCPVLALALTVAVLCLPGRTNVARSAVPPKIQCLGRVNNLLFARLKTVEASVAIEARQAVGKRILRSLSVTNAEGTAPLFGTKMTAKAISVRVLPNGARSTIKVTSTCAPATGTNFGTTFVSALVKIVKGERATLNVGIALLTLPANTFGFKSALVKITKPDRPTPTNPADTPILGPFIIDTGGQQPIKPLILEFPYLGAVTADGKAPISAEFTPANTAPGAVIAAVVQLPVSIGGGLATVPVPGPGQIVITPKPSPLPLGPPPLPGREPGEPDPAELTPEVPAKKPALTPEPTKPGSTSSRRGLLLSTLGKPGTTSNPIITVEAWGSGKQTVIIPAPTDPEESISAIGWAPDATKFTYQKTLKMPSGSQTAEIWVADADGSNKRFLITGYGGSTWAPDGKQLALPQDRTGGIAIIGLQGETIRTILTNHRYVNNLQWSPDGNYIAFSESTGSVPTDTKNFYTYLTSTVFVVRPDETDLRSVFTNDVGSFIQGWGPKSDQLVIGVPHHKRQLNETGPIRTTTYWLPLDGSARKPFVDDRKTRPYFLGQSCSLWARGGCG
jgi:WD40-like Beta Propeller Repeat